MQNKKTTVFDPFFSSISDEDLFKQMSEGNSSAQDILIRRYEHLGRQLAGTAIRTHVELRGYTDNDYLEIIHDTINRAFRYYQLYRERFFPYCYELLSQAISRRTSELELEAKERCENVYLDASTTYDDEVRYHDVIGNLELSSPKQYEVDEVLDYITNTNNRETKIIARTLLLSAAGYTIREISEILRITTYKVRTILEGNNDNIVKLKTKFDIK